MPRKIASISVFIVLTIISSWTMADSSTTTSDPCNQTIDDLAKPYQLQYRPSMSSVGCGIGSLTNFNLFGGSLSGSDFFKNALCSAVRAKIQPYVDQVNSGVSGANNVTSMNQVNSGLSSVSSGSSPTVIIDNYSSGTTSNLNQLFK